MVLDAHLKPGESGKDACAIDLSFHRLSLSLVRNEGSNETG